MLDTLTSLVTVLLALSVASERLVELVKGRIAWLDRQNPDPEKERDRQFCIHLVSVVASGIVVALSSDYIGTTLKLHPVGIAQGVALAILASGGSSMWNSVLGYLYSIKNLKSEDVAVVQKKDNNDLRAALPMKMSAL